MGVQIYGRMLHKNQRKRLRIRNQLIAIMIMLPSVFQVAFVYHLLCAHGLDFGQNITKCFQFLFAKYVSVARTATQTGAFHVVCDYNLFVDAVNVVVNGVVMDRDRTILDGLVL